MKATVNSAFRLCVTVGGAALIIVALWSYAIAAPAKFKLAKTENVASITFVVPADYGES